MAAQDSAQLARDLFDAFSSDDLDRAVGMAAEDIRVRIMAFGQIFNGRDRFRAFMQNFWTAFPDITVDLVHQVATGDEIVNEFTWTGTQTGLLHTPAGEDPATGRWVEARACEARRIASGELADLRHFQCGKPAAAIGCHFVESDVEAIIVHTTV